MEAENKKGKEQRFTPK